MIARAFPYDRPCRFQKFEATETILATGTTIWKPGFMKQCGGRRGDYEGYGRLASMSEDNALG